MEPDPGQRVELLAPAGSFEKLETVLHFGADAVYLAGKSFSLRNFAENFSLEEIEAALALAHDRSAKVYVAVNIYARTDDLGPLETYLARLGALRPDGIIIADPAVLAIAKRVAPDLPIHLSTQANTTNVEAVRFWQAQGVRRINAARELSLAEISRLGEIRGMQVEAFVHGAMCISYSGRCLLSNYMARRPSNQGMCCQPCRFAYAVVEETRPGQYFPVAEDEHGTYIFNSRDLCMLDHLPEMIGARIHALKIEGRMKGIHYAATAVNVYRMAIDAYYADPEGYAVRPAWRDELEKITSRGYGTGFYLGNAAQATAPDTPPRPSPFPLAGKVLAPAGRHKAHIEVRTKLTVGDNIEIIQPGRPVIADTVRHMVDRRGIAVDMAQPGTRVTIHLGSDCWRFDLLRLRTGLSPTTTEVANP